MKTIIVNIASDGQVTLSDNVLGTNGEHNNTTLQVVMASEFSSSADYFRIWFDRKFSEKQTLINGTFTYMVPQEALRPPVITCQVVGYEMVEGVPVSICKSKTFKFSVDISCGSDVKLSTQAIEPIETAISDCGNAIKAANLVVEKATEITDNLEEALVSAASNAVVAETAAERAEELVNQAVDEFYTHTHTMTDIKGDSVATFGSIVYVGVNNTLCSSGLTIGDIMFLPDLPEVVTTGEYNDLYNKPYIPSKTSDLVNDSGFLTQHQSLENYATTLYVDNAISQAIGSILGGAS